MAKCHRHSHAWLKKKEKKKKEPQEKSQRLDFFQSITDLPIISGHCLSHVLSFRQWDRARCGKLLKNPSLCFCFSHPSLPKFSSLWLGGRRFPNKLAETCCLWVRPSSPPAGHQSCHPQCKQVALASHGEWAERVGVTQATPIQNSQLTSKPRLWLRSPIFDKR